MPRRTTRRCEVCGADAAATVQTKERRRMTFLCMSATCWSTYYRQVAEETK